MKKRILSLVLTLAMVLSLFAGLTITASAAEGYYLATSVPAVGDKIVIAIKNGDNYYALPNANKSSGASIAGTALTVTDGCAAATNAVTFEVISNSGNIGIKSTEAANYLGFNSNKISCNGWGDTKYATIAAASDGMFTISSPNNAPRGLSYSGTNFTVSNTGASPVYIFVLGDAPTPVTPPEETEAPIDPPAGDTYYEKVTALDNLPANFIIVNEASGRAFNGLDQANGYVDVVIDNGTIADANGAAIVEIDAVDGGYSLKITSGDKAGNYISGKSGANSIQFGSTAVANAITFADGAATILSNDTSLRYNAASGNDRFRYYKTSTTGASYILPALYREVSAASACTHANTEARAEVPATCTAPGTAAGTYCLDCGKFIEGGDAIAALGHDYVVDHTTAPTCTEAGLDTYTCSRCEASYTKEVAALGHTYENGSCTVCGAAEPAAENYGLTDTLADGDEVILYNLKNAVAVKNDNLGGDWYLGTTAVAPVNGTISTYDASIVWTVSVDAETGKVSFSNGDNKIVAWLSGSYVEITNDAAKEGADAAWTISDASIDDHTHLLGTAVKNNAYLEVFTKNVNQVSQLVALGYTSSAAASDANFGFQFYVKGAEVAHDHVWDEGTETTAATCTTAGVMTYACTVDGCEETRTEAIPALGHIDENSDNVCDRCEIVLETYTLWTSAPEVGYDYIIVAEADGKYYALDNTENGAGQILTCTEVFPANDAILCTGDYAFTAVNAADTASTPNEGIAFMPIGSDSLYLHLNSGKIRAASGTANAVMAIAESADVDEAFTITALQNNKALSFSGSKFISGDTASAVYFYAKASAHVHAYDEGVVTTAPTCVAEGVMTYTCECGDSYTEAIPATGEHDYVEGICSVCGAEEPAKATYALVTDLSQLSDGAVIVLGNAANSKANGAIGTKFFDAVDATFADGYVSGDDVVEITLNVVDDGWTLSVDGTAIKVNGADVALCGEGDAATVWAISVDAATGAATISVPGTDPLNRFLFNKNSPRFKTYTSDANASMILPEIYVKGGTIVVCEHENTEVRGDVAATCTTAGYTGDTYCLDCGKLLAEGEEIAALGHNYVEGVCDRCGATEPVVGEYAGLYYIAANGYYATNDLGTASTKRLQGEAAPETLPESVTIAAADNKTFEVVSVDGGYVLKASAIDGDNYVTFVANGANLGAEADAYIFDVIPGETEGTLMLVNENDTRYLSKNSSNAYFGWYAKTQKYELTLIPVVIDEDAHTHNYVWDGNVGADGSHTLACECGETKTEACACAAPVETPATCIAYSSTAYTCDICGYTWTVTGEEYGAHNYENGVCTVCGEPEPATVNYELVTDAADLAAGDKLLIVAEKNDTYYAILPYESGNNCKAVEVAAPVDDVIALAGDSTAAVITLGGAAGNWTLSDGAKYLYAAGGTSKNYLKGADSADALNAQWTIAIADGVATIVTADAEVTRNSIMFNENVQSGVASPLFSCYASGQTPVKLYKAAGEPVVPPVVEDHESAWLDGQDATCENDGFTGYYYCVDCLESGEHYGICYADAAMTEVIADITIAALGHDWVAATAEDGDNYYLAPTCTEDGMYVDICSRCGEAGSDIHTIDALGHDWAWDGNVGEEGYHGVACSRCPATDIVECTMVDGTCSICGYNEAPAGPTVVPALTLDINTSALALEGATMLRMCVHKNNMTAYADVFNTSYMEVVATRFDQTSGTYYTETTNIYPQATLYSKNYYSYNIENIPAAQLNDSLVMTIHAFDASGNEYVGNPITYSAALRALKFITDGKPTANTMAALLRYAGAFQTYFGYNTANLASDLITPAIDAQYPYVAPAMPTDAPPVETLVGATITNSQKALNINGTVGISLSYKGISKTNMGNYSLVCSWSDAFETDSSTLTEWEYRNTSYGSRTTLYDFAAAQMRTRAAFTVMSGETAVSDTLYYSIADYVAYCHEMAASNATAAALCTPMDYMLAYGDAANAYFGG